MIKKYNIAVVGATGAVGEELFIVLEDMNFPINNILPLASKDSVGMEIEYGGLTYYIEELTEDTFKDANIDIAFFSAGGSISAKYVKYAVDSGAIVIDNTSFFRNDKDIPLIVPEVNPEDIKHYINKGIIANPNCSTIQMVQIIKPIFDLYNIKRIDVSTYQAVSGAGKKGIEELLKQTTNFLNFNLNDIKAEAFQHTIAFNVIPHIDTPQDNGYTKEEMKMVKETNKILHSNMAINATCVRVPVLRSHSESITITVDKDIDIDLEKVINSLEKFENIKVINSLEDNEYPMPNIATSTDYTYVGRIRKDIYDKNIVHLWGVADQIRIGAATNAVRIAKKLIKILNELQ